MKMILAFIIGVILTVLAMGVVSGPVLRAQRDSFQLSDLLPDIEKIYREALVTPFQEVEPEIYDVDVANYYHKLLHEWGLDESTNE